MKLTVFLILVTFCLELHFVQRASAIGSRLKERINRDPIRSRRILDDVRKATPRLLSLLRPDTDWNTLKDNLNPSRDSEICNLTVEAFTFARELINDLSLKFEDVNEVAIEVCEDILNMAFNSNTSGPGMCHGIINIQGPHVFKIIKEAVSPRKISETLNFCFPAEISKPNISFSEDVKLDFPNRSMNSSRATLKVVQLTDVHIDPKYAQGSSADCGYFSCCRKDNPQGSKKAGEWGEYTCNIPQKTAEVFLKKANSLNPDFILYSGDAPPHHAWDETLESQSNCTENLIKMMRLHLPGKLIYPNIGNHEGMPTNIHSPYYLNETRILYRNFANWWKNISMFDESEFADFKRYGFYSKIHSSTKLRILSLNTNFMYTMNFYNAMSGQEDAYMKMIDFAENTLQSSASKNEKILLILHHPLGESDSGVFVARRLTELISKYSSIIKLIIAGHTHRDAFNLIMNKEGTAARAVVLVAPPLTTYTNRNPSMRVYTLDASTFEPITYEQYSMDMMKAATRRLTSTPPPIDLIYNTKDEYGLDDLSAPSYHQLSERLQNNDALLDKYNRNQYTRSGLTSPCDSTCRTEILCRQRYSVWDRIQECIDSDSPPTSVPSSANPPTQTTAAPGNNAVIARSGWLTSTLFVFLFALYF